MTTSSTIPAVKQQLVTLIGNALTTAGTDGGPVPVFYAWNPDVTSDCVFLGRPILNPTVDVAATDRTAVRSPTAERTALSHETYTIEGTSWSFRPDLLPENAYDAQESADALWRVVRRTLAPQSWVGEMNGVHELRPFEKGWAALVSFTVEVFALIT